MVTLRTAGRLEGRRVVVIGAGPTGLGAASRLVELGVRDVVVLEREHAAGGLSASFVDAAGFTWDVGGHVQFSHYDQFDEAMDRVMGGEWIHHDRESWVWMRDRFVPYPLQNHVHLLPDAEKRACVLGLLRRRASGTPPANFAEWLTSRFGEGLSRIFMLPYNAKVWAYPPEDLGFGWVGERVAEVDVERVVLALIEGGTDPEWGPNRRFRFPASGGTGEIWRRVAARLPTGMLRYGAAVSSVDLRRRTVHLAGGARESYDVLVSTMPLDELLRMTGEARFSSAASRLKYSTVHVVGVGVSGVAPPELARKSWVYYPEGNCPFFRLTVFSNYSPRNVPDASRHWSVMTEVAESPHAPVDRAGLVDAVLDGLRATRVLRPAHDVASTWHYTASHGYPTPFVGRDEVVSPLLDALARESVYSRGRFGAWKYEVSNQDHSYMQGVEVVDHLAHGCVETTLNHPSVVNAARRPARITLP